MRTLSITLSDSLYNNLKQTISSRKISKFVSEAVEEKLNQRREALYHAYCEASNDSKREQELKMWDEVEYQE